MKCRSIVFWRRFCFLTCFLTQVLRVICTESSGALHTWLANGHPENVVDMVFLSEGYTSKEKYKFLEDMSRFIEEEFGEGKQPNRKTI